MNSGAPVSSLRYARSGALAGAVSTFTFTIIHHVLISDIWFSLAPMLAAGALCGALVSWSYALLAVTPAFAGWVRYNLLYVALFGLLGVVSVLVFDPVTTMAAVVAANAPPADLIRQALPMTVIFTLGMALLIGMGYPRSPWRFAAVLLTCVALMLLLGLNISAIGLVAIPAGSLYVIIELFGLIVALNLVYAAVLIALERRTLWPSPAGLRRSAAQAAVDRPGRHSL